jgi:hypothetical protein
MRHATPHCAHAPPQMSTKTAAADDMHPSAAAACVSHSVTTRAATVRRLPRVFWLAESVDGTCSAVGLRCQKLCSKRAKYMPQHGPGVSARGTPGKLAPRSMADRQGFGPRAPPRRLVPRAPPSERLRQRCAARWQFTLVAALRGVSRGAAAACDAAAARVTELGPTLSARRRPRRARRALTLSCLPRSSPLGRQRAHLQRLYRWHGALHAAAHATRAGAAETLPV